MLGAEVVVVGPAGADPDRPAAAGAGGAVLTGGRPAAPVDGEQPDMAAGAAGRVRRPLVPAGRWSR